MLCSRMMLAGHMLCAWHDLKADGMERTCLASSRVGASTMTLGRRPRWLRSTELFASSRSTMGSTNASVFPCPVLQNSQ